MDFDPRDYDDSRDQARRNGRPDREPKDIPCARRGSSESADRDGEWYHPYTRSQDREGVDVRTLGRGPANDRQDSNHHTRDRRDDARWAERDRDTGQRDRNVPDAFDRHVWLPRGPERELVRDRGREYTLRGSETRTLATRHGRTRTLTFAEGPLLLATLALEAWLSHRGERAGCGRPIASALTQRNTHSPARPCDCRSADARAAGESELGA